MEVDKSPQTQAAAAFAALVQQEKPAHTQQPATAAHTNTTKQHSTNTSAQTQIPVQAATHTKNQTNTPAQPAVNVSKQQQQPAKAAVSQPPTRTGAQNGTLRGLLANNHKQTTIPWQLASNAQPAAAHPPREASPTDQDDPDADIFAGLEEARTSSNPQHEATHTNTTMQDEIEILAVLTDHAQKPAQAATPTHTPTQTPAQAVTNTPTTTPTQNNSLPGTKTVSTFSQQIHAQNTNPTPSQHTAELATLHKPSHTHEHAQADKHNTHPPEEAFATGKIPSEQEDADLLTAADEEVDGRLVKPSLFGMENTGNRPYMQDDHDEYVHVHAHTPQIQPNTASMAPKRRDHASTTTSITTTSDQPATTIAQTTTPVGATATLTMITSSTPTTTTTTTTTSTNTPLTGRKRRNKISPTQEETEYDQVLQAHTTQKPKTRSQTKSPTLTEEQTIEKAKQDSLRAEQLRETLHTQVEEQLSSALGQPIKLVPVEATGNCFYHCINAATLTGTHMDSEFMYEDHITLRRQLASYIHTLPLTTLRQIVSQPQIIGDIHLHGAPLDTSTLTQSAYDEVMSEHDVPWSDSTLWNS